MTDTAGRLRAFAYLNADKAALYRAVMRVFVEAKTRFAKLLKKKPVRPDCNHAARSCGFGRSAGRR